MNRRELERLAQGMADGTLSAEDVSLLEKELLANPASREFYRRSMRVEHLFTEALHLRTPPASQERMMGFVRRRQRKAMEHSVLVAAALLLLSALVLHHIFLREPDPSIRMTFSPGTSWSGQVGKDGKVRTGESVRINFGVAELKLPGNVRAVIEGPAEIRLPAPGLLELREGTGWFRVGESGHGFRVRTPWTEVVDLGTEFGVVTRLNELDSVHVFEGRIRCSARFAMKEVRELREGQASRVSPVGRWIEQEPNKQRFLKKLPPRLPGIRFSFDGENPLRPEGEDPAVADMKARTLGGGPASLVDGVEGKALSVRELGDVVKTDWPGIGGAEPRTIACWIRPDGGHDPLYSGIVSWGAGGRNRAERCQLAIAKPSGSGERILRFSLGHQVNFSGSTPIIPGAWQHIAVVFRGTGSIGGDMVELYVNGERDQVAPEFSRQPKDDSVIRTIIDGPNSEPLQIGVGPFSGANMLQYFGDIDEVWILPRALSAREVKGLSGSN